MKLSSVEKRGIKNRFLTFNMNLAANAAFAAVLSLKRLFLIVSIKRKLTPCRICRAVFAAFLVIPLNLSGKFEAIFYFLQF